MDESEISRSIELGEKALGYTKFNGTLASPENYELWYTFAAGINRELIQSIKSILETKSRLEQSDIEKLYKVFFQHKTLDEKMERLGSDVAEELSDILTHVTASADSSQQYGEELGSFGNQLETLTDPAQLKQLVSALAQRTVEMSQQTSSLAENLIHSKKHIQTLQSRIVTIRDEAMTDALTRIANRKKFDLHIAQEMTACMGEGTPMCLAILDVDHFKKFNDDYGHQTGDQVLRLVAAILSDNVKGKDLVARYGGEEFAIILPNTGLHDAISLTDHIRKTVAARRLVKKSTDEQLGNVTISTGIALCKAEDTIETLIERADKALYTAKEGGRNCVKSELDLT